MRRNVSDLVVEKIVALIGSGLLQVGDGLPSERELAAALNVSRVTVRSGIQTLAERGVLEVTQGARTRVISTDVGVMYNRFNHERSVNSYALQDIHAARLAVELQVAKDAAERIDDAMLTALDRMLVTQAESLDDPVRFLISDREFHLAIYHSCGNPVLGDFVSSIYSYMIDCRRVAVTRPGGVRQSYDDHVKILRALHSRNPQAVSDAFEVHLNHILTTTRDILGRENIPKGRVVE